MNIDPTVYWRGYIASAEANGEHYCHVLTVDLRRVVLAWGHALDEIRASRAEVQRLQQIVRLNGRS